MNHLGQEVLSYFSWVSGPLLAGTCGAIICLVPNPNVLKNPSYWLEDLIIRIAGTLIITMLNNLYKVEYWSNFKFENSLTSYLILNVLGVVVFLCTFFTYYCIWSFHYGYYQPMPFNGYVATTPAIIAINAASITR